MRDGRDHGSPGLWQLTIRLLSTCSSWLDFVRSLCEAASNSATEGWLRDRALGAIVGPPLTAREAAFLRNHLDGRLARCGHFRWQEERDGIAGMIDWALLSVLLDLACDPTCVMLGRICESFREAADLHMGTPMGCSTACQSQVLPHFRPKHVGVVSIRKVVVLGSFAGGKIKVGLPGESCFSSFFLEGP